jgi:glycine dehydrogenase subunit 1
MEIEREMRALAGRNFGLDPSCCFLGAGTYHHYRPATVDYVLQRGEFYSAYTPYQPEVSQGELQAMFEFQSMICRLTGMEVSNSSHYDGATSLAEAVLLALNAGQGKRDKIVVSPAVHPQYRAVVNTYLRGAHAAAIVGEEDTDADLDRLVASRRQHGRAGHQNPNRSEAVGGLPMRPRAWRPAFRRRSDASACSSRLRLRRRHRSR